MSLEALAKAEVRVLISDSLRRSRSGFCSEEGAELTLIERPDVGVEVVGVAILEGDPDCCCCDGGGADLEEVGGADLVEEVGVADFALVDGEDCTWCCDEIGGVAGSFGPSPCRLEM